MLAPLPHRSAPPLAVMVFREQPGTEDAEGNRQIGAEYVYDEKPLMMSI